MNVFSSLDNFGSCGAIVRDDHESFVGASCTISADVFDAGTMEAIAMREGLILAKLLVCHSLVAQSDCMEVVQTLN